MDLTETENPPISCHVIAMPCPGRGHINPMMNLCKLIASSRADMLITIIVTEEWLGFLSSESKPNNIRFRSIPNVVPSELVRAADVSGFHRAVLTELEAPVELLLDRLQTPVAPNVIIYDTKLTWVVRVGNRRNIPVASFWTQSATMFSLLHHYDLLVQNGHLPVNLSEVVQEKGLITYIPGVPSMRFPDLPITFYGARREVLHLILESILAVPKAQYLLFSSVYELEARVIDALKANFDIPIHSVGPAIPYFNIGDDNSTSTSNNEPDYFKWLDNQPKGSVLYISQGSFLSVSGPQLEEIVIGVHDSGVRYFWAGREETSWFGTGNGGKGLVVPWCDQLKVLCHSSVGGFWSHCGWNSIKESAFAGVPILTFPIGNDQSTNSKIVVDDWKIGWRVKRTEVVDTMVKKEDISCLVQRFMDFDNHEVKEMRRRAKQLKKICQQAAKGGSSETDINAFIKSIYDAKAVEC